MLKEETLNQTGRREYEEPDGELIEVLESGNNTITVLTRIDTDKVGEVDLPFEPAGYSVKKLDEKIVEEGLSSKELEALKEAEEEGKARKTAFDAIEKHQ